MFSRILKFIKLSMAMPLETYLAEQQRLFPIANDKMYGGALMAKSLLYFLKENDINITSINHIETKFLKPKQNSNLEEIKSEREGTGRNIYWKTIQIFEDSQGCCKTTILVWKSSLNLERTNENQLLDASLNNFYFKDNIENYLEDELAKIFKRPELEHCSQTDLHLSFIEHLKSTFQLIFCKSKNLNDLRHQFLFSFKIDSDNENDWLGYLIYISDIVMVYSALSGICPDDVFIASVMHEISFFNLNINMGSEICFWVKSVVLGFEKYKIEADVTVDDNYVCRISQACLIRKKIRPRL